jgi:alanyl-tRNA synthetase
MKASELKQKYLEFFRQKGHAIIGSAPIVPENDPTVLFTTAGMHPLVPYLMGQPHPLGKRLADVQKCLRTQDIDEVGDNTHTTFFEMLGNWSLGDYFKKDAIEWSFEFLTGKKWLGIPKERLAVTCFAGDNDAPRDNEAAEIWQRIGMPKERIAFLPKEDNWWGPAGETGPCGPDTEMFCWTGEGEAPKIYDPKDKRWVEIWNDVFMQYSKARDGTYGPLRQRNVDTGLGVERVAMVLQGKSNIFETELFMPIMRKIEEITGKRMDEGNKRQFRIIADHMRAAVFILGDERGIVPSNTDQGYILRRYVRRVVRHLMLLGMDQANNTATVEIAKTIIGMYGREYPLLEQKKELIFSELQKEQDKFQKTLVNGIKEFERMCTEKVKLIGTVDLDKFKGGKKTEHISLPLDDNNDISGKDAFLLFQSFGFPIEMTKEMAKEKGINVDVDGFKAEYERHQALSRVGAEQKFKGGLSEASEATAKLHTATHLLNEALRQVVSKDIRQRGSNITPERLRFDFNFDRKLTPEEIKKAEDWVNARISEKILVSREEMGAGKAKAAGAQAEFGVKYPEIVSVYSIGKYSREICMGPHVKNTSELGTFKIVKEESSAAGIRRIKAVLG